MIRLRIKYSKEIGVRGRLCVLDRDRRHRRRNCADSASGRKSELHLSNIQRATGISGERKHVANSDGNFRVARWKHKLPPRDGTW